MEAFEIYLLIPDEEGERIGVAPAQPVCTSSL